MSIVIIGGRDSILNQIPKEIKDKHPRLKKALDSEEVSAMLTQSLEVLQDSKMKGSHILFTDIVRIILALQLSVSETNFSKNNLAEQITGEKVPGMGLII